MTSILKVDTIQTAAGGTPTAADLGLNVSGSVLQVVQTQRSNTDNGGFFIDTATSSWVQAGSAFQVAITPSSTSSKILISTSVNVYTSTQNTGVSIFANGSNLGGSTYGLGRIRTGGNWTLVNLSFLYSPSTTNEIVYTFAVKREDGSVYVGGDGDGINTFTAIEIAG